MCVHVREKANSSRLRSGRPVLPGAQVCPHGRTRSSTHLRITRESPAALPHPADSLPAPRLCALLVPSVRQTRKPGHGGLRSRRCYLLGYQHRALGPEAQQLLRRGERQEGGDVCRGRRGQRGSWFLRDRWRRRHCRGPNPGPTPRTRGPPRARQGSVSRTLPPTRVQPHRWPWPAPSAQPLWLGQATALGLRAPRHDTRCPRKDSRCMWGLKWTHQGGECSPSKDWSKRQRCPRKTKAETRPFVQMLP